MQRKKETEVSELEKQKFYEKRKHGTPRFPMECFVTRADGNQHFLVPLHWHRNIEIMQMLHGTAVITIGNETFSAVEGDIFCINQLPMKLKNIFCVKPCIRFKLLRSKKVLGMNLW